MMALLALIPTKDKLYGILIIALLIAGFSEYKHIQHKAATAQHTADINAEAKAAIAAAKQKEDDDADYAAKLKSIQDQSSADLQTARDASDLLTARLRAYTAHRCSGGVLQGSTPAAPAGAPAPGSAYAPEPTADVTDAIGTVIGAAYHDVAVINAERAERDALTGK